MSRDKILKLLKAIAFPHMAVAVLCTLAGAAGLVWVFSSGNTENWPAYPIYVLSFYALITVCTRLIPWSVRLFQNRKHEDPEVTLRQKLYSGLTVNWIYGIFLIVTGVLHEDTWLWTNGIYNMVLALIRFCMVLYERRLTHSTDPDTRVRLGWNSYLLCGAGLLLLNLTMTGILFHRIWKGISPNYPELVVYAVAAYTFYRLTLAIIHVVQSRKNTSPILAAKRNLDLCGALLSLFSLQTALLSVFGNGFGHIVLMNTLTGTGISLAVVCGAVAMLIHGTKIKKRISGGSNHE